jgi:hypothetical protein
VAPLASFSCRWDGSGADVVSILHYAPEFAKSDFQTLAVTWLEGVAPFALARPRPREQPVSRAHLTQATERTGDFIAARRGMVNIAPPLSRDFLRPFEWTPSPHDVADCGHGTPPFARGKRFVAKTQRHTF